MLGFLTRALILVFGYVYPAYDCYKIVELIKPDIDQLRFWCQYWILLAVVTALERFADNFVSWLPMYSEAKLAFIVYLWYPKSRGTSYVYGTFFKPYLSNHEAQIDQFLNESRTLISDLASRYFERISGYGQTRFYELLQYIASQSASPPGSRPVQRRRREEVSSAQPQTPNTNPTSPVQPPPVPYDPLAINNNREVTGSQPEGPVSQTQSTDETNQSDGGGDVANGEETLMGAIRATRGRLTRRLGLAGDVGSASSSH